MKMKRIPGGSNRDPMDDLLDRPIAFNPAFKKITGSTVAALMLSQAWYWSKRTSDLEGWFYKTIADWQDETGLTRAEQETARKYCAPFLEIELRGVPATLHYRIKRDAIYQALGISQFAGMSQTGLQQANKQESEVPTNYYMNAEITTKTTTESDIPADVPKVGNITKEDTAEIVKALETLCGGGLNSMTANYVSDWQLAHEKRRILQAVEHAQQRGGRSVQYVDAVLAGWEKDGKYPPTKEERKARSMQQPTDALKSQFDLIDKTLQQEN